jgi:hypothetical protein
VRARSPYRGRAPRRLRSELGQAAVEFALVLPLFLALVCSVVEFSRLYYVRLTVRDVTLQATRLAATGRQLNDAVTGKPLTRAASIQRAIRSESGALRVGIDSISINPADGGAPGQVVQVRVFYRYEFMLAPLRQLIPSGPFYFSVGSSMKNEPVFD